MDIFCSENQGTADCSAANRELPVLYREYGMLCLKSVVFFDHEGAVFSKKMQKGVEETAE
jgi:hypothetical protein